MKANSPHVISSKAQDYATKFYDNNCSSMDKVASKIAEKKTFILELGVDRDDNDDIIAGLVKPKVGEPLLTGPNLMGKYTVFVPTTATPSPAAPAPAPAQVPAPAPVPSQPQTYSVNR
jgi:hypothetical protein